MSPQPGPPASPRPTRARLLGGLGWAVAFLASGWATVHTLTGPPPEPGSPPPQPLPRPPTPTERAELQALGTTLATELARAEARYGGPLPVAALEASDPTGRPWLPSGLPDNPLTPAVAWVLEHCGDAPLPRPPPDWSLCPATGLLRAGGLDGTAPLTWSLPRPPDAAPSAAPDPPQRSGKL